MILSPLSKVRGHIAPEKYIFLSVHSEHKPTDGWPVGEDREALLFAQCKLEVEVDPQ